MFVAPPQLQIEEDILEYISRNGIEYELGDDIRGCIGDCDAIYMTRLQDEWDVDGESKAIDYDQYSLTYDMAKDFKPNLTIMHPLPRRHELDQELDALPQAKYWDQVRNGMWMRAALMASIFNVDVAIRDHAPDLVISDDGLQHYALPRSAEIVVVDGQRGLGNGRCLPEGPLREPATRLKEVDFVVSTGGGWSGAHPMIMRPADITSLATGETLDHQTFLREHPQVHAVAGIGNPKRFFNLLSILGLSATPHVFPDHHAFQPADLAFADGLPVLMTEKDAVKCAPFAEPHWWYLPVTASLPEGLLEQMLDRALGKE
jgi:hypothetical protein